VAFSDERVSVPIVPAGELRPSDAVCVSLERWFVATLLGFCSEIQKDVFWSGTDEEIALAVEDTKNQTNILAEAVNCTGLEMITVEIDPESTNCFRILSGITPISDWICAPAGATGATGTGGADGICDTCGELFQPPAPNPDYGDSVRRCVTAWRLAEWLFEKFNDTLDYIEALADTVSAADAVIALFPPAYVLLDQIMDAINEVVEADINIIRAWDTVEQREIQAEKIFCALEENGVLEASSWENYVDSLEPNPLVELGEATFRMYLEFLETAAIIQRAAISGYGSTEETCIAFECEEAWEYVFDFITNGSQDWVAASGYSVVFDSGQGFKGGDGSNLDRVFIYLEFPAPATLTEIEFTVSNVPATNLGVWICQNETGVSCAAISADYSESTVTKSVSGTVGEVALGAETSPETVHWGYITSVTIRGVGANPFE
jgi:hypothetical protein